MTFITEPAGWMGGHARPSLERTELHYIQLQEVITRDMANACQNDGKSCVRWCSNLAETWVQIGNEIV
jgi:hypothetical protein